MIMPYFRLSSVSLFLFAAAYSIFLIFPGAASAQSASGRTRQTIAQAGQPPSAATAAPAPAAAAAVGAVSVPRINFGITPSSSPEDVSVSIQILILLTVLSLAPSILVMTTSFTRIVIVLSFVRRALATQQLPSNQILIGLSIILTFFVMTPTFVQINEECVRPFMNKEISQTEALNRASDALRDFMLKQTRESDLSLFISLARGKKYEKRSEVPFYIVMPAFVISEMKVAFEMGIIIFLPFLAIDMVVASILMSMGMIMLPPIMISLPFKILIFVLADGWHLIVKSLVSSFA